MKKVLVSLLVIVAIACNKKKEDNPQPNKTVPKTEEVKPKTLDSTYYQKLYFDDILVATWLEGRGSDTQYVPHIGLYTQGTTIDYLRCGYSINQKDGYYYYFDEKTVIKNYKIVSNFTSLSGETYYITKGYVEGKINNKNVRVEFNLPI